MLFQNRRFETDPKTGFVTEKRDFVPGDDRIKMLKLVPIEGATAWWDYNLDEVRELHVGMMTPKKEDRHPEVRTFPTQKDRTMMSKVVPATVPHGHRIAAWWEGDPEGENANSRVVTLCIGLVVDKNAPPVVTDGLDDKSEAELLTIAGTRSVKDMEGKSITKAMKLSKGTLIALIRTHEFKKKEAENAAKAAQPESLVGSV